MQSMTPFHSAANIRSDHVPISVSPWSQMSCNGWMRYQPADVMSFLQSSSMLISPEIANTLAPRFRHSAATSISSSVTYQCVMVMVMDKDE
jgi:hypothetical protein